MSRCWCEGTNVGQIADGYDAMRAVGRSADRSVTITLGGRGGVEVELADDVMFTHTEAELARQIAGAARVALAGFRQEQKQVIDTAVDEIRARW
jgi:hypothetical protein